MAATILIKRWTGSGPTGTDITSGSTRLKQADNGTADTNNPVPAVSTSLSCWASTRLNCSVAPANSVSNLKWYSDGVSAGTGLTVKGNTATSYVQAVTSGLTSGGAGELNTTNYSSLAGATTDVSTYTSGSTKSVSGSTTTTGDFGDFFAFQLSATSSASPGPMTARTYTWQYDET